MSVYGIVLHYIAFPYGLHSFAIASDKMMGCGCSKTCCRELNIGCAVGLRDRGYYLIIYCFSSKVTLVFIATVTKFNNVIAVFSRYIVIAVAYFYIVITSVGMDRIASVAGSYVIVSSRTGYLVFTVTRSDRDIVTA